MNSESLPSWAPAPFGEARLAEIEAVAAVLRDSAVLTEIEVRQGDDVLRVRRSASRASFPILPAPAGRIKSGAEPFAPGAGTVSAPGGDTAAASPLAVPAESASEAAMPITASLVGVFHALRPPLAPGDRVAKGQIVGQIEAMRLMNDVSAPIGGTVAAVHVEEGQPVEYGQPLFEITPADAPQEKTS